MAKMARTGPEHKRALTHLKNTDIDLYKAKIRGCRLVDPSLPFNGHPQPGLLLVAHRKERMATFLTTLSQTLTVGLNMGDTWLLEDEFVSHVMRKRSKTQEEAQAFGGVPAADLTI